MKRGISDNGMQRISSEVARRAIANASELEDQPYMREVLDTLTEDDFEYYYNNYSSDPPSPETLGDDLLRGRAYDFDIRRLFMEMADVDSFEYEWPNGWGTVNELMVISVAYAVAALWLREWKGGGVKEDDALVD